jgi:tetratricopeptide (TPR) repeat protein
MFEFGREIRRLFANSAKSGAAREGLTGGDVGLLDLLDLSFLKREGRAADDAVARTAERDRAERLLHASVIWREAARRTGDPAALRKSASAADMAACVFKKDNRMGDWGRALSHQAASAMLGADLYGDEGLNAAARFALNESVARTEHLAGGTTPLSLALARIALATLDGQDAVRFGEVKDVLAASARFDAPLSDLAQCLRHDSQTRLFVASAGAARADLLILAGARLKNYDLVETARKTLTQSLKGLDPVLEPLTWTRLEVLRASALTVLGELTGDAGLIADAVAALTACNKRLTLEDSPLDWARLQHGIGRSLCAMGEATDATVAYDRAVVCFERALLAMTGRPQIQLATSVRRDLAVCLLRRAELKGDLSALAQAEAAFRADLANLEPGIYPVAWALCQMDLARVYEVRAEIVGRDDGERAAAAVALTAALDVFAEQGLRSLTDLAHSALERLRRYAHAHTRPNPQD